MKRQSNLLVEKPVKKVDIKSQMRSREKLVDKSWTDVLLLMYVIQTSL